MPSMAYRYMVTQQCICVNVCTFEISYKVHRIEHWTIVHICILWFSHTKYHQKWPCTQRFVLKLLHFQCIISSWPNGMQCLSFHFLSFTHFIFFFGGIFIFRSLKIPLYSIQLLTRKYSLGPWTDAKPTRNGIFNTLATRKHTHISVHARWDYNTWFMFARCRSTYAAVSECYTSIEKQPKEVSQPSRNAHKKKNKK